MLRPNECRMRHGDCVGIDDYIAAAMTDTPCDRQGGGPLTSSGYALVNADQVPTMAPGSDEASKFRADLDHELFHVYEYGLNVEVIGKVCEATPTYDPAKGKTWLTEASAEWASFGFFPVDDAERRTNLSMSSKPCVTWSGLQAIDSDNAYQAALYLQFVQQEAGSIQPVVDLWTTSQAPAQRKISTLTSIPSFRSANTSVISPCAISTRNCPVSRSTRCSPTSTRHARRT